MGVILREGAKKIMTVEAEIGNDNAIVKQKKKLPGRMVALFTETDISLLITQHDDDSDCVVSVCGNNDDRVGMYCLKMTDIMSELGISCLFKRQINDNPVSVIHLDLSSSVMCSDKIIEIVQREMPYLDEFIIKKI